MDRLLETEGTFPAVLRLRRSHWEMMRQHVEQESPLEACGLLGGLAKGDAWWVERVFALTNQLRSPIRYRLDPKEQWQVFQELEAGGLELAGIYHSHPNGPAFPSSIDVAEAYYPQAIYLIWHKSGGLWECQAFTIRRRQVNSAVLEVVTDWE